MSLDHFPLDSKPFDPATRAFHRINAPDYDKAVDTNNGRRGAKAPPAGNARDSGARGPEAFKDSGFLENVTKLLGSVAEKLLLAVPVLAAINGVIATLTGKNPIKEVFAALGRLISSSVEGALFARYLRAIPSWVPVGRKGYTSQFTYIEDGSARNTNSEEEREIEGVLSGSYPLANDVVFTQWTHFRHWAFHVVPTPGFRYLIGRGNIKDPNETRFITSNVSADGAPRFRETLSIYGQNAATTPDSAAAIECIMDVGAISKPPGNGGSAGVMFDTSWPYWPMTGDYFWAVGRWAYDCMRGVGNDLNEVFPTQINPIKAFATSRVEGVKFPENRGSVPATRFFFFATSEGGYTEFRDSTDRNGKTQTSGISLNGRDYDFIVDLPPHDDGKSPYPLGATINFALNRLVLRPRLLILVRQAPFGISGATPVQFADGLQLVEVEPKIVILRPADPLKRPTQVKITIPLSKLPTATTGRAVGIDISMGWHDPDGNDTKKLVRVQAVASTPFFHSQSGAVRFVTAINGRWKMLATTVSKSDGMAENLPAIPPRKIHDETLFLPKDAPVSVTSSGIWHHGFGEFLEENSLKVRELRVGGLLIDLNADTKQKLKKFVDDARKKVQDLRDNLNNVKDPKKLLKAQLQKQVDDLKAQGADQRLIDNLQSQVDQMVDSLPDTPAALKTALGDLDKRLGQLTDVFDAVDDFLKITDDLIGTSFAPGWHEDIDAAINTGLEESKRVSAIARSMFLHPTPIVNRADEPLGWVEFVDTARISIGRDLVGEFLNGGLPLRFANVAAMLARQQGAGNVPLRIRFAAPRMTQVGSGNNLAAQINPSRERFDYDFEVNFSLTPQT